MRAHVERGGPPEKAVESVLAAFGHHGLEATPARWTGPEPGVMGYEVRKSGKVIATSTGKGRGPQSVASGLFEAWEHRFVPLSLATTAPTPDGGGWDPPAHDVGYQLDDLLGRLTIAGYEAYWARWDPDTEIPVVCVLVPGLETFFLARQGIPVLPSGRAAASLLAPM
ncbi:MAG: ribosomal protein methylthiotransferase accessory factor [Actinomycetota bacterium]|nr:ribosomal protein methylthiotransferase accessory factor [Actinomycetota bacterium]